MKVTVVKVACAEVKQVINPTAPLAVTAVLVLVPCVTATSIVLVSFHFLIVVSVLAPLRKLSSAKSGWRFET